MWLLLVPWGALIQGFGMFAAVCLFIRIGRDLYREHRARQSNS